MINRRLYFAGVLLVIMSAIFYAGVVSAADETEWTLLVYMNADNDLDPFSVIDFREIESVKGKPWLTTVVLVDRATAPAGIYTIRDGETKLVREVPEPDMGSYTTLIEFVKEGFLIAPAEKTALVIWNHGRGWKGPYGDLPSRGISFDDQSGNHITTNQLNSAFAEIKRAVGRNLDILAFDACNMQMLEVICAVYSFVDIIVGAEEIVPLGGMPYDRILNSLSNGMNPDDFSKAWVKAFNDYYSSAAASNEPKTTLSAVNSREIPSLMDDVTGLSKALMSGQWVIEIKDVLFMVQKFHIRENIDLRHFNSIVKSRISDEAVQTACVKLEAGLDKVISASGNTGGYMQNAKGIAIYFPLSSYGFSPKYSDLQFAKTSLWDEMVFDYYKKNTGPTIIADIKAGNPESLRRFAKNAKYAGIEVVQDIVERLNFSLNSARDLPVEIQTEVKNLLLEIRNSGK